MNEPAVASVTYGLLPIYALFPGLIILCFILRYILRISDDVSVRFVAVAIWLRLVLSAFHVITFTNLFGPFSINALGSIAIVAAGILLIRKSVLLSTATLAIFPMLGATALSAAASGEWAGALDMMVKFLFAMVVSAHIFEAIRRGQAKPLGQAALLAFCPELVLQLFSVVLGVKNYSSFDGSANYIGGYRHEGAFSMALIGMLAVAALVREVPFRQRAIGMALGTLGLLLANYRTAIVAGSPIMFYFAVLSLTRIFPNRVRLLVTLSCGIMVFTGAFLVMSSSERFAGMGEAVEKLSGGLPAPESFTRDDQHILTGRVYIWANYYNAWKSGDSLQKLVGVGPETWSNKFKVYAHNSFFHYLYEIGIIGLVALTITLFSIPLMGLMGPPRERIGFLAVSVGYLFLNMATMPLWQIEGLLTFGIILGLAASSFSLKRKMPYEPIETDGWRIASPPGTHALSR